MKINRSILILGGTGAMGTYLIKELSKYYKLIVTSRQNRHSSEMVQYIKGNAHDLNFVAELISDSEFYAIVDFMNYSTREFKSRVDMFLEHTKQYFYLSSARVYANSEIPLREESPRLLDVSTDKRFLLTDDYALAKARQEDILKNTGKKNWTIIRPYMSYFYNRLDLGYFSKEQWLFRILNGKTVVFPKNVADSLTTLTHGKDVAKVIAALVGKEDAKGEIFQITLNKSYKWKEIIDVYVECLEKRGFSVKIKYIPKAIINDNYIYCYDRVYNRVFDNTKIQGFIDTTDFIDTKVGITECINQFLEHPTFGNINWIYQAFIDKITSERTELSSIKSFKDRAKYFLFRNFLSYKLFHDLYQILKKYKYE